MPQTRRWKWVQSATGAQTVRAAAAEIGVNHGTVSRWLKTGIPMNALGALVIRFECDPIEALVVWGYLEEDDIGRLNFDALVRYIPIHTLAREIERRAGVYSQTRPDTERKTSVGMLRRA
jgi:hypothetical protein